MANRYALDSWHDPSTETWLVGWMDLAGDEHRPILVFGNGRDAGIAHDVLRVLEVEMPKVLMP